jgi:hypothetical protein
MQKMCGTRGMFFHKTISTFLAYHKMLTLLATESSFKAGCGLLRSLETFMFAFGSWQLLTSAVSSCFTYKNRFGQSQKRFGPIKTMRFKIVEVVRKK